MTKKSDLSIRAAVMNCAARCAESSAPLASLGEFLEKLASMGWDSEDVVAVEKSVLQLLGKLQEESLKDKPRPNLDRRATESTGNGPN